MEYQRVAGDVEADDAEAAAREDSGGAEDVEKISRSDFTDFIPLFNFQVQKLYGVRERHNPLHHAAPSGSGTD